MVEHTAWAIADQLALQSGFEQRGEISVNSIVLKIISCARYSGQAVITQSLCRNSKILYRLILTAETASEWGGGWQSTLAAKV